MTKLDITHGVMICTYAMGVMVGGYKLEEESGKEAAKAVMTMVNTLVYFVKLESGVACASSTVAGKVSFGAS